MVLCQIAYEYLQGDRLRGLVSLRNYTSLAYTNRVFSLLITFFIVTGMVGVDVYIHLFFQPKGTRGEFRCFNKYHAILARSPEVILLPVPVVKER